MYYKFISVILALLFAVDVNAAILFPFKPFIKWTDEMCQPDVHKYFDIDPKPKTDHLVKYTNPVQELYEKMLQEENIEDIKESVIMTITHSNIKRTMPDTTIKHIIEELPIVLRIPSSWNQQQDMGLFFSDIRSSLSTLIRENRKSISTDHELFVKLLELYRFRMFKNYREKLLKGKNYLYKISGIEEHYYYKVLTGEVGAYEAKICSKQDTKNIIRESLHGEAHKFEEITQEWLQSFELQKIAEQVESDARSRIAKLLGKNFELLNDFSSRVNITPEKISIDLDAPCGEKMQITMNYILVPVLRNGKDEFYKTPYINMMFLK